MSNHTTLLAIPPAVIAIGITLRWWLWPKPIPGIPHNKVTSIWGDMLDATNAMKQRGALIAYYFEPLADQLGPICQVVFGPLGNLILISDAQEMEDLLVRHTQSLDTSPVVMELTGGVIKYSQISLKSSDPHHRKHRRLVGPSMTPKYLRFMTPRITSNIDHLITMWREKMKLVEQHGGSCFSCPNDLQFCTMDSIGEICFGESFHCSQSAEGHLHDTPPNIDAYGGATFPHLKGGPLFDAVDYLLTAIEGAMSLPDKITPMYYFILKLGWNWRRHHGALSAFVQHRILEARERFRAARIHGPTQDVADCIVDMIMQREGKEDPETMSDVELVDELIGLVFGGQDTTSSSVSFGLKYLSNNPEVQIKLREELLTNLDSPANRMLTYDDVASAEKLPYLEAVVSEILRLASVGGGVYRQALEDMTILGHHVPKGSSIFFLTGYVSRKSTNGEAEHRARALDPVRSKTSSTHGLSKGLWEENDAEQFRPERWLVEEEEGGIKRVKFSPKQGVSAPFGIGPRACFGMKLGILQVKLFVASLNLAFFFDRIPEALNDDKVKEVLLRHPIHSYVSLKEWDEMPPLS